MARTVVIVGQDGRLIDVTGASGESSSRYAKFAARLLGDNGSAAVLNYGWNGRSDLVVTGASGAGNSITLDAMEVVVPGDLRVGGKPLQDIVDWRIDTEMSGILGTPGEIDVTMTPADEESGGSSDEGPRNLYTIGLDRLFLDRFTNLEDTVRDIVRLKDVFYIGDGLSLDDGTPGLLEVKLGTGLKFEDDDESSGSDSPEDADPSEYEPSRRAIAVDCDDVPVENSVKPITSGAVFDAIGGSEVPRYIVGVDPESGNMVLYDRLVDGQDSSGDLDDQSGQED